MDGALISRLEQSFRQLAPRGPELIDHLFAHLFSRNPELRPMFPRDMSSVKQKFLATLMFMVRGMRTPEKLRRPLIDLGRRLSGHDLRPEHFARLRDTLISVMRDMTGPAWTAQLTQDWTQMLNLTAGFMIEGRHEATNPPHALTLAE